MSETTEIIQSEDRKTEESPNNEATTENVTSNVVAPNGVNKEIVEQNEENDNETVPLIHDLEMKSPVSPETSFLTLPLNKSGVQLMQTNSSLSLLASYATSSEDETSSSSESSSESSSSSDEEDSDSSAMDVPDETSSSSSSSSVKAGSITDIQKKIEELDEDLDEREEPNPFKVPGELSLDDLPPIEDLHITMPEMECALLGHVLSIVDQLVMVESLEKIAAVDLDTVLFLDKGQRTLGKVFDVLGPIQAPIYCIRFNKHAEILEKQIIVGLAVYCAPKAACTNYVVLPNLMQQKGSDASWRDDVEPPARYLEFSDDEEERNARRERRTPKQRDNRMQNGGFMGPLPRGYCRQNPAFRPQTPPHYPPQFQPPYMGVPPGQFYVNPFAYTPNVQFPPNPYSMFGPMPPPPPPPPPPQWSTDEHKA